MAFAIDFGRINDNRLEPQAYLITELLKLINSSTALLMVAAIDKVLLIDKIAKRNNTIIRLQTLLNKQLMTLKPAIVRVDASTICQLRCTSCPTTAGAIDAFVGSGFLKLSDFRHLIENNDFIKRVELTNWGEIFLNPELPQIIRYAYERGVELVALNGVNFNTVKPEVLETLVKYRFRAISVSIDGATQETYEKYRVRGNLETVLSNIRKLNEYKKQYRSSRPELQWQYVVFGHNEHEIEQARALATELGMRFQPKLNWEDMYDLPYSAVQDKDMVRDVLGAADREEFHQKHNKHFCSVVCGEMWTSPQVSFDGEVLGCPVNHWSSFGNAFKENLVDILNGERMNYARAMLTGEAPGREDIPCTTCKVYLSIKDHKTWIKPPEQQPEQPTNDELRVRQNIVRGYELF